MAISVTNCGDSSKMRKKDGVGTGNTKLENLTVTGTTTVAAPVNDTDAVNKTYLDTSLENVIFGTDVEEVVSPTVGHVPTLTADGQLQDSGKGIDDLMLKVATATAGNLPSLTADGQLVDSGQKIDDIGGACIVTVTMNYPTTDGGEVTLTADKTAKEIMTAYNAGKSVACKIEGSLLTSFGLDTRLMSLSESDIALQYNEDTTARFYFCGPRNAGSMGFFYVYCDGNNNWSYATIEGVRADTTINNVPLSDYSITLKINSTCDANGNVVLSLGGA